MTTKPPARRIDALNQAAFARGGRIAVGIVWIVIVAGLGIAYASLGLGNPYVGFLADDALYLLMAELLSPWQSPTLPVYEHVRAHSQLPPLFPLALGLVGGGSADLPAVRMFVAVAMAAAVIAYRAWLGTCDTGPAARFALPILFALMPLTLLHVIDIWSEGLYVCLSLLALSMFESLRDKQFDPTWCFALGILVGCTIATRTIGVALIPVMVIACLRARCLRAWLMWAGLAVMLGVTALVDMGQGGTSYADLLLSRYATEPLEQLTNQLALSARAALDAMPYGLFQWRHPTSLQWTGFALVMLLGGIGFSVCLRRLQPAALYILAYSAIVAVWPYPQLMDRFVFPVVPLILYYVVRGGESLGALASRGAQAACATIVVLIVLALPGIAATAAALSKPPAEPAAASFRTTRYWLDPTRSGRREQSFSSMQGLHDRLPDIARHVRPDACIHTVLTNLVLVQAQRIARLPPAEALLREGKLGECEYYYVSAMPFRGKPSMYPYALIDQHVEIVAAHREIAYDGAEAPIVGVLLRRRRGVPAGGDPSADFE